MRAIAMTDYDSGVALHELPMPEPAPNELLVRVNASSLNRIDVLTDREYRESAVQRIEPGWMPGISRTHTFNALDGLEVIDGVRSVLRHRPSRFLTFGGPRRGDGRPAT